MVGCKKRVEGGTHFGERSKDESREEGMKTDVENQSEVGGIYRFGTLDTSYPIW